MNQFTNHNKLIEALDFRIEAIEESKNLLERSLKQGSEKYQKEKRKSYYFSVAYFVHTIWENYDLRILFEELLLYKSKLNQKEDYLNAVIKINKSIKFIASYILSHSNFEIYEKKYHSINWINPFERLSLLKIRELLEQLKNIDTKNSKLISSPNDIFSLFIGDGLNSILGIWIDDFGNEGLEEISKSLDGFAEGLRFMSFHEQFQYDYFGVNSGLEVQSIYRNLHPLFIPSEINEVFLNSFIKF